MVDHASKRLAALRAEKKRRLQCENGIESCEGCSVLLDTCRLQCGVDYFSVSEDCIYLCATCADDGEVSA